MNDALTQEQKEQLFAAIGEEIGEDILSLFSSFGYEITEADFPLIAYGVKEEMLHILNITHQREFPKRLLYIMIRRVVGNFLYAKLQTGTLSIGDLDLAGVVSSITEGDTSVSFGTGTSDLERLTDLISYMRTYGEDEILCFRRIKWH